MSIEPDLHATSDALLADLERLRDLELEKRDLPVGSPRLVELATEIEQLAAKVLGASDTQVDLAKEALEQAQTGELDPAVTINELSDPPRELHSVLAEWRDAERRLSEADPASIDAVHIRARIIQLRTEYRQAHEAAVRRATEQD